MGDAIFMLGVGILGGVASGAVVTSLFVGRLYRRCTQLEWAVADLQDRASTFKGREMADKRWKKADALDTELARVMQATPAASRRYDNDPLGT
jgi:hypothetical protein